MSNIGLCCWLTYSPSSSSLAAGSVNLTPSVISLCNFMGFYISILPIKIRHYFKCNQKILPCGSQTLVCLLHPKKAAEKNMVKTVMCLHTKCLMNSDIKSFYAHPFLSHTHKQTDKKISFFLRILF